MTRPEYDSIESDKQLVERVRRGDPSAYETLVGRYERLVRAAVLNITRDQHAGEDAAQETFLAAYGSLATLREPAKFGPWLLSIARIQAGRVVRSHVRAPVCVPDIETVAPHESTSLADRSERLLEFIERLPEHERVIVGLRYFDGHSVTEIACISGRPVGTVTKQLSRAHARLEQWLYEEPRS